MNENGKQIIAKMGKLEIELLDVQIAKVRFIDENIDKCSYCLNKIDTEKITKRIKEIKKELEILEQKLTMGTSKK